ncbi:MAG: hypothetical protein AB7G11_09080 [Phycisphaerales bacterium]
MVFCPLGFERAAVRRGLDAMQLGGGPDPRLSVVQTGPGRTRIREAVEHEVVSGAIAQTRSMRNVLAILAGVAGELATVRGAAVVGEVVDADAQRWRSPSIELADAGAVVLGLDAPAWTPEEKAAWRERSGAVLVDTESHEFARTCERFRIPWLVIRAASDRRHEVLPDVVTGWVDPQGRTRAGRVLKDMFRRPALIAAAWRLGRRSRAAMRLVAQRVSHVALTWQPTVDPGAPGAGSPITPMCDEVLRAPLILVFGGSFDPPHRAHVELPVLARERLEERLGCEGRGQLVYVPAARSPFKQAGSIAPDADRAEMLRIATRGVARACVWTDEIDRAHAAGGGTAVFGPPDHGAPVPVKPSYTIETIERLNRLMRETQAGRNEVEPIIRLLIGADQAKEFHRWKDCRRLISLAEPIVMLRPGDGQTVDALEGALRESGAWSDAEIHAWRGRVVPVPLRTDRATDVRETLAAAGGAEGGADWCGAQENSTLSDLVDPGVLKYVRERGLYQSPRPAGQA